MKFEKPLPNQTANIAEALEKLKKDVPFLIRFERTKRKPHADLENTKITLTNKLDTPRKLLLEIKKCLGTNWQITLLPGYVIIYKERKKYTYGTVL